MVVETVRRYFFCASVIWLPLLSVQFCATANDDIATPEEIVWLNDYSRGLELARATGKPILIAFRCVP